MALAKAVVTGSVYRTPEKRFTQNNVPISSFVMNIGDREEMLLRVISKRQALDDIVSALGKDDKVLVEGRLQITTVKNENGADRKIFEIDANTVEPISGTSGSSVKNESGNERRIYEIDANTVEPISGTTGTATTGSSSNEEIVKFAKEEEFADELIGEDEIPF